MQFDATSRSRKQDGASFKVGRLAAPKTPRPSSWRLLGDHKLDSPPVWFQLQPTQWEEIYQSRTLTASESLYVRHPL